MACHTDQAVEVAVCHLKSWRVDVSFVIFPYLKLHIALDRMESIWTAFKMRKQGDNLFS